METGTIEILAPVVVMVAGCGLAGFIVWVVLANRRRSNGQPAAEQCRESAD
jgi:hypothetical protein